MKDLNKDDKDKLIEELRKLLSRSEEIRSKSESNNASLNLNLAKFGISDSDLGKNIENARRKYKERMASLDKDLERAKNELVQQREISKETFERKLSQLRSQFERLTKSQEIDKRAHWDKLELMKNSLEEKAWDWEKAFKELHSPKVLNEKKIAQVKVYLTETEKRILENLAKEKKSDNSSVMRELLRTKGNPNLFKPVLNFSTREGLFSDLSEVNLKVLEPKSFDDIREYIEYLDEGYAIIINLENINNPDLNMTQRCIDFVSGATYKTKSEIVYVGKESILVTTNKCSLRINKESK